MENETHFQWNMRKHSQSATNFKRDETLAGFLIILDLNSLSRDWNETINFKSWFYLSFAKKFIFNNLTFSLKFSSQFSVNNFFFSLQFDVKKFSAQENVEDSWILCQVFMWKNFYFWWWICSRLNIFIYILVKNYDDNSHSMKCDLTSDVRFFHLHTLIWNKKSKFMVEKKLNFSIIWVWIGIWEWVVKNYKFSSHLNPTDIHRLNCHCMLSAE